MATKSKVIPPVHPGETLREEFLIPLGLTANRLAIDLLVPVTRVNDIVRGKRANLRRYRLATGSVFRDNAAVLDESPGELRPGTGAG